MTEYIYFQLRKDITLNINVLQIQDCILHVGNIINIKLKIKNRIELVLLNSCFLQDASVNRVIFKMS